MYKARWIGGVVQYAARMADARTVSTVFGTAVVLRHVPAEPAKRARLWRLTVLTGTGKMASTMQLEFTQAMTDFKTMFPDMDDDVIEAVLRANQGAVDATIDQLLAMSTDNQNERLRLEMERVESCTPSHRKDKRSGRQENGEDTDTTALV